MLHDVFLNVLFLLSCGSNQIEACSCILYYQIVHWKNHLKFPDEIRLSPEAKDLISRLLCDAEHRLGSGGADQIKVSI